ncbi:hypothetical protein ACT7C1_11845 [Bacillus paranthracis]
MIQKNIIQSKFFMPAWAKDANGKSVSTHYKVDGNKLIQVVDFACRILHFQ